MSRSQYTRIPLSVVCLVMVPLAMAPKPEPEKIQAGPVKPGGGNLSPTPGLQVLEERDGSDALTRQVVLGGGTPLWQILADGSSQYLHEDPRSNVVMLTEGAGSPAAAVGDVVERVTYDPYGKPFFQDAANQNKTDGGGNLLAKSDLANTLLYRGRWYDPETGSRSRTLGSDRGGLYDFGGRFLNPDEGRFVTRSGAASGGANRYGFAGHAPVSRSKKLFVGGLSWSPGSGAGRPQLDGITITKKTDTARPEGKFELKVWTDPKELQKKKKLGADGIVGAQTWPGKSDHPDFAWVPYGNSASRRIPAHTPEWKDLTQGDPGRAATGADMGVTIFDEPDPVPVSLLVPAVQKVRDSGGGGDCCDVSCSCPPPPPDCCGVSCSCG